MNAECLRQPQPLREPCRSGPADSGFAGAERSLLRQFRRDCRQFVRSRTDGRRRSHSHRRRARTQGLLFRPAHRKPGRRNLIADRYDVALSDNAVCHRNLNLGDSQCVFISTRLMDDKFSVAFEFYINVGHALVERAGVSQEFSQLAWSQVEAGVRGETSLDAWEARKLATADGPDAERYKNEYLEATFSDTISIYLLSLYLDVDYYDLRERDYPLLAPSALAERLRKVAELFPPNSGFEFAVLYKRR